jgi:hypothetical protein
MPKEGRKTVPAKSRGTRPSGSPWGCSPPSSLPLCGSVMTRLFFMVNLYGSDSPKPQVADAMIDAFPSLSTFETPPLRRWGVKVEPQGLFRLSHAGAGEGVC